MLDNAAILILNHMLKDADWARRRLQDYYGRRARISAPPVVLSLGIDGDGYFTSEEAVGEPDVEFTLPEGAPVLALQGGQEALMKQARVSGAADFADALGFVLKNLRWDVEEDLSKVFGDIAAHRMVDFGRRFIAWQKTVAQNGAENVLEYLQEEKSLLPHRREAQAFSADLARLQERLEQLEKRATRLT